VCPSCVKRPLAKRQQRRVGPKKGWWCHLHTLPRALVAFVALGTVEFYNRKFSQSGCRALKASSKVWAS
jgi:hypothetical protein